MWGIMRRYHREVHDQKFEFMLEVSKWERVGMTSFVARLLSPCGKLCVASGCRRVLSDTTRAIFRNPPRNL